MTAKLAKQSANPYAAANTSSPSRNAVMLTTKMPNLRFAKMAARYSMVISSPNFLAVNMKFGELAGWTLCELC